MGCWVVIAVFCPSDKAKPVRESLIHFGDDESTASVKNEVREFVIADDQGKTVVFVYRQTIKQHVWSMQQNKMLFVHWLKEESENTHHTIIDLAPDPDNDKSDNIGFL